MPITIRDPKWKPRDKPGFCDKLEFIADNGGKLSWYFLDIAYGKMKAAYRVQSATCIPMTTHAGPRNVTGKLPHAITDWVAAFLAELPKPGAAD